MKVFYASSAYRSFSRAARMNRVLISSHQHDLVSELAEADIVVLHCEPFKYPALFERHPSLRHKYVVACAAWEADPLPSLYTEGLSLVQEVWTPSTFSAALFSSSHENVHLVPHPIYRDLSCDLGDFALIDEAIRFSRDRRYFLTIARTVDKRKNIPALVEAFTSTFGRSNRDVLVIKGDPGEMRWKASENVICIDANLTDFQINALYRRASAYISAHHGEAWGLTISDALLFRLPILATKWSGNLDYLSDSSAFLIPAQVRQIDSVDCFGLFEESMKWAYPSQGDISAAFERVCSATADELSERTEAAFSAANMFSMESVGATLAERLAAIT